MEILGRIAAKGHQIRFDYTGAAARADGAIGCSCPPRVGTVGGTNGQRIHAVRRHLHPGVADSTVHFPVVTDRDGHQGITVGQQIINHRGPGVNVGVFDGQVRPKAEINELVLARQQNLFDKAQRAI